MRMKLMKMNRVAIVGVNAFYQVNADLSVWYIKLALITFNTLDLPQMNSRLDLETTKLVLQMKIKRMKQLCRNMFGPMV